MWKVVRMRTATCPKLLNGPTARLRISQRKTLAAVKASIKPDVKLNKYAERTRREVLLSGYAACPCCIAAASARSSWYDSYFAFAMAHSMDTYEAAIRPVKEGLFRSLLQDAGVRKVLEVGVGTAVNLQYLQPAANKLEAYVGLDPNAQMRAYAEANARNNGFGDAFQFVEGSIQDAPFESGTFDAAVMTLVLCSVPDPAAALSEIKRVLKPGAHLYLIEHVAAGARRPLLNVAQTVLDPLQNAVADGCHLTRHTGDTVKAAGFTAVDIKEFDVDGLGFLAPHISGTVVV